MRTSIIVQIRGAIVCDGTSSNQRAEAVNTRVGQSEAVERCKLFYRGWRLERPNNDKDAANGLQEPEIPEPEEYGAPSVIASKIKCDHALLVYERDLGAWERNSRDIKEMETHI